MDRLINAPNMKEQPNNAYETVIFAGTLAFDMAKNYQEIGRSAAEIELDEDLPVGASAPPVILFNDILENVDRYRIAPKSAQNIKIYRADNAVEMENKSGLSSVQISAICANLARYTQAQDVKLFDGIGQIEEDLSAYVQRLRTDQSAVDIINKTVPSKLKENDRTNKKARAFVDWLNMDVALNRINGELYQYDGIAWAPVPKYDLIDKAVQFFDELDFGYSDRSVNSMIETIKIQSTKMGEQAKELLAFKNGVLNRSTLEFSPHCREDWLTSFIPHDYKNQAENTPHFDKWLDFVADGKADKKQAILAALYAILTNRHNWQLFFEITGDGGSGKSVFAQIATLLAGEKNTESGRLVDFDEPRRRERFADKSLIICPEQSRYGGDGGGLKSISGGDALEIDPKNKTPFKAVIPAIVLIVNNEPTKFTERSGGIERRRVVFSFDKVVPEKERDPYLMDKITAEAGGIIYKLIHSFKKPLDAKKALHQQQESEEALQVKMEADHITAFCCYFATIEKMDGLFIGNANMANSQRTHLYPAYLAFIQANNINGGLTLNNFSKALKQGLKQHKNRYAYQSKHTNKGVKTNVIFKSIDDFFNEVIKSQ